MCECEDKGGSPRRGVRRLRRRPCLLNVPALPPHLQKGTFSDRGSGVPPHIQKQSRPGYLSAGGGETEVKLSEDSAHIGAIGLALEPLTW